MLSAFAGTTVPGASGSWSIPNIDRFTDVSAVSLLRFMSQRPGLVRLVGVRVLRYYDNSVGLF